MEALRLLAAVSWSCVRVILFCCGAAANVQLAVQCVRRDGAQIQTEQLTGFTRVHYRKVPHPWAGPSPSPAKALPPANPWRQEQFPDMLGSVRAVQHMCARKGYVPRPCSFASRNLFLKNLAF